MWTRPNSLLQPTREELRVRFLNVIRLAGYTGDAPEQICNEWLDKQIQKGIPDFIKMMEDYEAQYSDPRVRGDS